MAVGDVPRASTEASTHSQARVITSLSHLSPFTPESPGWLERNVRVMLEEAGISVDSAPAAPQAMEPRASTSALRSQLEAERLSHALATQAARREAEEAAAAFRAALKARELVRRRVATRPPSAAVSSQASQAALAERFERGDARSLARPARAAPPPVAPTAAVDEGEDFAQPFFAVRLCAALPLLPLPVSPGALRLTLRAAGAAPPAAGRQLGGGARAELSLARLARLLAPPLGLAAGARPQRRPAEHSLAAAAPSLRLSLAWELRLGGGPLPLRLVALRPRCEARAEGCAARTEARGGAGPLQPLGALGTLAGLARCALGALWRALRAPPAPPGPSRRESLISLVQEDILEGARSRAASPRTSAAQGAAAAAPRAGGAADANAAYERALEKAAAAAEALAAARAAARVVLSPRPSGFASPAACPSSPPRDGSGAASPPASAPTTGGFWKQRAPADTAAAAAASAAAAEAAAWREQAAASAARRLARGASRPNSPPARVRSPAAAAQPAESPAAADDYRPASLAAFWKAAAAADAQGSGRES